MDEAKPPTTIDRVQLGVRMARVLKGLAEFRGVALGPLLENIVLHSFAPDAGQEGEMSYSPHGKKALQARGFRAHLRDGLRYACRARLLVTRRGRR